MKIISGKYKGRKIFGYDINGTRPTMDRVKESLFSMLQEYLKGSICLDLFAGTGNLGLEAISMGAKKVYFVDNNIKAIKTIKENILNFDIEKESIILKNDYKKALNYFNINNIKFNIIFIDPPYESNYIIEALKKIEKYQLLENDGIVVCESDTLEKIQYSEKFTCIKNKKYGNKYIEILQYKC